MPQSLSLSQVVGMGARAGIIAACRPTQKTQKTQIQNLLEIVGAYEYPDSAHVLQLYIAYQVGRGHIDRDTARVLLEDIRMIVSSASGNEGGELLRRYLGAVKWAFTAVDKGRLYGVCRMARRLGPNVDEVIAAMFNLRPPTQSRTS